MNREVTLEEILQAREQRAQRQKELVTTYKRVLISFTLNTPGALKYSKAYENVHQVGRKELVKQLREKGIPILYEESTYKTTGCQSFMIIETTPVKAKKVTVDIEEKHPWGRIFDMDVIDANFKMISRTEIGYAPRKCLLCENMAAVCARSREHSLEALLGELKRLME